ncbi:threonine/homoserine/homoserine lactone efflux protein [Dyella sp. SG562]|uniref:LysE family translocator n=1 Tax=Dyella TaxID=231454 RepID=UPI001422D325|nr:MULTISPECIES: LysE family translocator [unclassified Dyella]NII72613.1 threonine/homoserine/homoserine lactone efflux protein [Dyella sp. SG562]NKJ21858.1 threonine/homoserine/homoserine lactone efflux protein [Dyella sp. SG609]
MESLGIQHFGAFVLACIALALTPGLDTFYILARSGREGRTVGVAAVLGINTGCLVHTLAAVLGISAILMTSALAFAALKYLGAAYLVWMGVRMLLAKQSARQPTVTRGRGLGAAFRQGMLTNVLNPKVALFFLAFLPQFVSMQAAHPQWGLAVLGLSFIGVGLVWSMVLAMLGGQVHRLLDARPHFGQWMDRACGTVLLGFGIRLAMQRQQ